MVTSCLDWLWRLCLNDTSHRCADSLDRPIMKSFSVIQLLLAAAAAPVTAAASWKNVNIGGGGGFVPGFVFHPTEKGVAYARTDIGGLYRLNADDSWTAVTDSITTDAKW